MNKIRQYFVKKGKLLKLKSFKPYIEELTVFIKVKIDSLNEFSKFISLIVNKDVRIRSDNMNIIIDKKYLFIS